MSKYEEWQKSSNAYRDKPTKASLKKAYDAFDVYRQEGIEQANKLTPAQEKANKEYLTKFKAGIAEAASGNKNMKEAEMNATGYEYKKGGKVSSASKRADGCCVKGKTKGKMV